MNYLHRWTKGDEPDKWTTERLRGDLNFYRFLRTTMPDNNELLDRIHDIQRALNQRSALSLDNPIKIN